MSAAARRVRIAAAQLQHETNVFSSVPTDLAAFERSGLRFGEDVRAAELGTNTAFGGFFAAEERHGVEIVPVMSVWATPSGMVTGEALDELVDRLVDGILRTDADAVALALHGAMVSERRRDADGYILERVREAVGLDTPLIATLDLHANISPDMVAAADVLIGYRTYPHVDMAARAEDAVGMCRRLLAEELRPAAALAKPPMLPTSQRMTTDLPPMQTLMERARAMAADRRVLDVTVAGGFPPADVEEAGLSVVVTTADDPQLALDLADELAALAWELRDGFLGGVSSWEESRARIEALPQSVDKPLLIVDIGDNPWTGGPGDSVELVRFLLDNRVQKAAVAIVVDPETVEAVMRHGAGVTLEVDLGGKTDDLHGPPLFAEATVLNVCDGRYVNTGPMMTGLPVGLGPTTLLGVGDPSGDGVTVEVIVTSRAETPIDPEVFRMAGVDPTSRRVLGLKGKGHFRAAFEPIVSEVILVEGPGITGADLTRLPFAHIRRPMWPLDPETTYR